jgi:methyltransferase (TIGR00027 family)
VQDDRPSFTAAWVAAMRGLGVFLPQGLRLVDDPFGLRFGSPRTRALFGTARAEKRAQRTARLWLRGSVRRFAVYMQIRTRVIDDDVDVFARAGGRQLVLLGAGFDCRAWRLASLSGATVFEVDHPATQTRKRAIMAAERSPARVVFVPWDFEHEPLEGLTARLKGEGHDDRAQTMTILEGVAMYLSEPALAATFDGIARYSASGSPLAATYMDRELAEDGWVRWASQHITVRLVGEPFRSGFDPAKVSGWLAQHGFRLERDESAVQAGERLLGAQTARPWATKRHSLSHFMLARRA